MASNGRSKDNSRTRRKERSPSPSTSSSLSSSSSSLYWFQEKDEKNYDDREDPQVDDEDEIFFEEEDTDRRAPESGWQGFGYYGNQGTHHVTSQRAKIIREILAQFDLEEVMDRYRGDSAYTGYNRRQSNLAFRLWLDKAMGNDKIPNDDRKWNDKIRKKVLADFERRQDEKEQRLADAESQRILKLKLQGLIKDDEGENGEKHEDSSKRKTAVERQWEKRTTKNHHSLYKPTENVEMDGSRSRRSRGRKQNSPTYYSPDIESQMEIMNRNENEMKARREKREQEQQEKNEQESSDDESDKHSEYKREQENGTRNESNDSDYYEHQPTYRGHLGRTKIEKKIVHPDLEKLYEEEDLDKLYREASSLLRRTGRGSAAKE